MTDAELIQMLRQRLATVEGAARDVLDGFKLTGDERLDGAVQKLQAALITDFRTALLSSPNYDESMAEWIEPEAAA